LGATGRAGAGAGATAIGSCINGGIDGGVGSVSSSTADEAGAAGIEIGGGMIFGGANAGTVAEDSTFGALGGSGIAPRA
jgi:hypothetical protein